MFFVALLLATVGSATATPTIDDCDDRVRRNHMSTSIHSDRDDENAVMTYTSSVEGKCQSATIVGRIGYSSTEDDIISMPFGAYARFRERTSSYDREMSVTRGPNGEIMRSYQVNGRATAFNEEARTWIAAFLPRILARTGVNAGPRVARWRSQGGIDNVLNNIAELESSGAMRAHYDALLNDDHLSSGDLEKTLRSVTETMHGSSGDISAILIHLAPKVRITRANLSSLERAVTAIPSSGDKTRVLQSYSSTNDHDLLLSIMHVAETIPSSGDRSGLLQTNAPRYLSTTDNALHDAFFLVAGTVPSSGDLRNVLHMAIPYASRSEDIARQVIVTSRRVASSGDRAAVLIDLIESGAVKTPALKDAFLRAAAELPSDGDRGRVLRAAVEMRGA